MIQATPEIKKQITDILGISWQTYSYIIGKMDLLDKADFFVLMGKYTGFYAGDLSYLSYIYAQRIRDLFNKYNKYNRELKLKRILNG